MSDKEMSMFDDKEFLTMLAFLLYKFFADRMEEDGKAHFASMLEINRAEVMSILETAMTLVLRPMDSGMKGLLDDCKKFTKEFHEHKKKKEGKGDKDNNNKNNDEKKDE